MSQEKLQTMSMQNVWGVKEVHYGIVQVVNLPCGGDGGVTQHGGHTPNNRLAETCSLGLLCTSLIYDMIYDITNCT